MADVVIKTKLLDDTQLVWDKRWIKNVEIKMQSSTDASQINYGMVPSSGSVKLIDIDGSIKSYIENNQMSKSNLQIQVYANGGLIHTFLSSDSVYSVIDNTLDIKLQSVLSKWDKIVYSGHHFGETTAFALLCEILSTVGYSENDVKSMTTGIIISNETYYTIENYLKAISIGCPKVEQMSVSEAVNMICGISQLQCVENEYGEPQFISGTNTKKASSINIAYIPQNNQYSSLAYDLFTDNKIEQVKVNYNEFQASENFQNVATYTVKVYDGKTFVATNPTYNPSFPSGQLASNGSESTTYRGVMTNRPIIKKETNVVPDSIDTSFMVKVSNVFSSKNTDEDDITADSWNGREEVSFGKFIVYDSEESQLLFNVWVKDNSGGQVTRQKVNDFTINVYKKTYSFLSNNAVYGAESENYIEISNTLFRPNTIINQTPIYEIIKDNLLTEYSEGVATATLTISFADYYNLNGSKTINYENGQMFILGQVIKIQGSDKYWEITGIRFRKTGVPMIDLELKESNVSLYGEYSLYKGISTVTRTYSPAGATLGELSNSDAIYEGDVLSVTYTSGIRTYTITMGGSVVSSGSDLSGLSETITVSGNVAVSITAKQWRWVEYSVSSGSDLPTPSGSSGQSVELDGAIVSGLDPSLQHKLGSLTISYREDATGRTYSTRRYNEDFANIYVDSSSTTYIGKIINLMEGSDIAWDGYPYEYSDDNRLSNFLGDSVAIYLDGTAKVYLKRYYNNPTNYLTQWANLIISQYEYS